MATSRSYRHPIDDSPAGTRLGAALAWRERDPNLSADEIDTMRAIVADAT